MEHFKDGNRALEERDYSQAIGHYTKAIALEAESSTLYLARARVYQLRGDNEKAISDCSRALALDPQLQMAYFIRGLARYSHLLLQNFYFAREDFQSPLEDLSLALADKPDHHVGYFIRAHIRYFLKGVQSRGWREDWKKALQTKPTIPEAHYVLGHLLLKTVSGRLPSNIYRQAVESFDKALEAKPHFHPALLARSQAHTRRENYDRAIGDLEELLDRKPGPVYRGLAYYALYINYKVQARIVRGKSSSKLEKKKEKSRELMKKAKKHLKMARECYRKAGIQPLEKKR